MNRTHGTFDFVTQLTQTAASLGGRFVPPQVLSYVDRALIDIACTSHGLNHVAEDLHVDPPAVDAWRTVGVPTEMRPRLASLALVGDRTFHTAA